MRVQTGFRRLDAETVQHGLQALLGEVAVGQLVTGVVKADNEAVSDQKVVPDPFEIDDILDTRSGAGDSGCLEQQGQCKNSANGGAEQTFAEAIE